MNNIDFLLNFLTKGIEKLKYQQINSELKPTLTFYKIKKYDFIQTIYATIAIFLLCEMYKQKITFFYGWKKFYIPIIHKQFLRQEDQNSQTLQKNYKTQSLITGRKLNSKLRIYADINSYCFIHFKMIKIQQKGYFHSIQQFHIFENKVLGNGSFGVVLLATHIKTCKLYAIKIINLNKFGERQQLKILQKQNKIHSILDHPHIVKLWDNILEEGRLYMVLQYVEKGTLFHYQNNCAKFTQLQAFKYFYQTLQAVKYLHSHNIIHRDLKPQNLLLDSDLNIKICDLGWATHYDLKKRNTFCGTYQYMAPQIIFQGEYDIKVDIWALGVLLYEMLHGYAPFRGQMLQQIKQKMKIGAYGINGAISDQCKDIIVNILKFQPQERITIQQIQTHGWVIKMQKKLTTLYIQNQYYSTNNSNLIKLTLNNIPNTYKTIAINQKTYKNTQINNNNRNNTQNNTNSQTQFNRNSYINISQQLNIQSSQKLTSYKQLCTVSTKNTINILNSGKKLSQSNMLQKLYDNQNGRIDLEHTPLRKSGSNAHIIANCNISVNKNNKNSSKSIHNRNKNQNRQKNRDINIKISNKKQNLTNFTIYESNKKQTNQVSQQFTKRKAYQPSEQFIKSTNKRCKTMNFDDFSIKKSKEKGGQRQKQKSKDKIKQKQKCKDKFVLKKKKQSSKHNRSRNLTPHLKSRKSQQKIGPQQFSIYIKKAKYKSKTKSKQKSKSKSKSQQKQKQLRNIKNTQKSNSNKNINQPSLQPQPQPIVIKKK